jgi:hypothetical protein
MLNVAITVRSEGGAPNTAFEEQTQTFVVNAHGAMIGLAAKVRKGQMLRLTHKSTRGEQLCKVMYLGPVSGGKTQVGVEFTTSVPHFWGITFPPDDKNVSEQAPAVLKNK